ncbi:MAG: hypothetical protein LRZ88_05295, partial [Candidatus Cloacimonetes bacterium]|nr:hypothetical protein [Candidatus Cloacimonadota bacterium]
LQLRGRTIWSKCRFISSDKLMSYAVIALFIVALDCRAALTSNSVHAKGKTEEHRACDGEN